MAKEWLELSHEKRAHLFPTYWYWKSVQLAGRALGTKPGFYGCLYKNHEMSYVTEKTGFTRLAAVILEQLQTGDALLGRIEEVNEKEIPALIALSRWFSDTPLSTVGGEILFARYQAVYDQFLKMMTYSIMGTVLEFEQPLLSNAVEALIKKRVGDDAQKLGAYFIALTSAGRPTTPEQEEVALRRLKIKSLMGDGTEASVAEHARAYSYIAFGYDGPGWSMQEVVARLGALPSDSAVLEQEIAELVSRPAVAAEAARGLVETLRLNTEEKRLVRALSILGFWKFERKLANQKSHELMEPFFDELATRLRLSKWQAKMIAPGELRDALLRGHADADVLNERLRLSAALFEGFTNERILVGEEAHAIEQSIEAGLRVDSSLRAITGTCAYPGQAEGVVRRVDNESDLAKFKAGDVLVSTSTTPKIIAAMRQASAIVTDSGGITCHAAIVSRELKVPCVIGTKIATRFLKDGDKVEVNATQGIITKL